MERSTTPHSIANCSLVDRQSDGKGAILAELPVDGNLTAMRCHQILCDGQAKAGARPDISCGPGFVDLVTTFEFPLQLRSRNTRSFILDYYFDPVHLLVLTQPAPEQLIRGD